MVLVIDNYDSFTYNLVQYLQELGAEVRVCRNDEISADGIERMAPTHVVISPGPGTPDESGVALEALARLGGKIPILGVCLGHQCIAQVYGGRVVRAPRLMHGKTSPILHDRRSIFAGLPSPLTATRYHSLIAEEASVPACLEVSARTPEGEIMGLRHREFTVEGIQFHPESVLTEYGREMLTNFLRLRGGRR